MHLSMSQFLCLYIDVDHLRPEACYYASLVQLSSVSRQCQPGTVELCYFCNAVLV